MSNDRHPVVSTECVKAQLVRMVLSVFDIQGIWIEQKMKTVWLVDGITAKKDHRNARHFVLSGTKDGIEWDDCAFVGTMEGNILMWRDQKNTGTVYTWARRGEGRTKKKSRKTNSAAAPQFAGELAKRYLCDPRGLRYVCMYVCMYGQISEKQMSAVSTPIETRNCTFVSC